MSRFEIEWIGREGLAPETHDAYLKVTVPPVNLIPLRTKLISK